jgi:arylsulfatase A-like enzyme
MCLRRRRSTSSRGTKRTRSFLYLAYTTPHANNELTRQTGNGMEVPGDHAYSSKPWPKPDRDFAGVVAHLDRDIGKILAKLRELGIEEDTIVMFASDNGPHKEGGNDPEFFNSNGPLRGIKRDLYEGGIRTPFIATWPSVILPGQVTDAVCAFWDVLPTCAELAGAKRVPPNDGISFLPVLHGKQLPAREYLYWEFHEPVSRKRCVSATGKAFGAAIARQPSSFTTSGPMLENRRT